MVRTVALGAACALAVVGRGPGTDVAWIYRAMARRGVRVSLWSARDDGTEWPAPVRRIEIVNGPLELVAAEHADGGGRIVAAPEFVLLGPDGAVPLGAAVPGMPVRRRNGAIAALSDVATVRVPVAFVLSLRAPVVGWAGDACALLGITR